jgi:radical SAM superfamily enzyme YgiQ (UPF0313 family)
MLLNLVYNYNGKKRGLPIGPLCLVAALKESRIDVDFLDYQLVPIDAALDVDWLLERIPYRCMLAISCMYSLLPLAVLVAQRAHDEKDCLVVMGGIGPGGVAEELSRTFPFIRLVVVGAGEEALVQAAVGRFPEARVLRSTSEWLLSHSALHFARQTVEPYTIVGLVGTVGCPYRCSFCDIPAHWGHTVRYRPIEMLVDELQTLVDDIGIRDVYFYDDTLVTRYDRVAAICSFARAHHGLRWKCFGRLSEMSEDLLAEMGSSGCDRVFFGVESGSQKVLDRIGKQINLVDACEIMRRALAHIRNVRAQFIIGFPFETIEDCQQTMNLMGRLSDEGADVGADILVPLPGSRLYTDYRDSLRFVDDICDFWLGKILEDIETYRLSDAQRETRGRMKEMIARHPSIFAPFYVFAHPELRSKLRMLSESRVTSGR